MFEDYPLPPNEEDTEILRVVIRESMALDLIDKLIADICAVTESLGDIENDFDLAAWEPFPKKQSSTKSKSHDSKNAKKDDGKGSKDGMKKGIHKAVC
jgi:glutamate decarboxylase